MLGFQSPYQWTLFLCMYIGYMFYITCRRSFSFVIPNVVEKDGLQTSEVGGIISSFALAYSIGKFVNGILVDKFSPRLMFTTGLFFCGLSNLLFSYSESRYFSIIWFFNGLCQGPGWPACAKILQRWYSPVVFGTLWSILSTSMNIPASVGPLASSLIVDWNGGNWRQILQVCGTASCGFAAISLLVLKDRPEDVGLTLSALTDKPQNVEDLKRPSSSAGKTAGSTWGRVLSSLYTYVISIGFLMSLLLKGVVCDWGPLYLIKEKKATQLMGGTFVGVVELGGFIGSIVSGICGDRLVAHSGFKPKGQPRHSLVIVLHVGLLLSLMFLRVLVHDVNEQQTALSVAGFVIGFCIYGVINTMGVLAMENSASDISGTAHAFCALIGNCGLMAGGLPFSMLLDSLSWDASFQVCELVVAISAAGFVLSQFARCRIGDHAKSD